MEHISGPLKRVMGQVACMAGDHDWTSRAQQGIPPSPSRMAADPIAYFDEYATMYCARCGHVSAFSAGSAPTDEEIASAQT